MTYDVARTPRLGDVLLNIRYRTATVNCKPATVLYPGSGLFALSFEVGDLQALFPLAVIALSVSYTHVGVRLPPKSIDSVAEFAKHGPGP